MHANDLTLNSTIQHPKHGHCRVCFVGEQYVGLELENHKEVLIKKETLEQELFAKPLLPEENADKSDIPASWPDSTFVYETAEAEHFPGSHWLAFFADAQDLLEQLPEILPQASVQSGYGDFYPPPRIKPETWREGVQLAWPERQQGLAIVIDKKPEGNGVVGLFPFSDAGMQQTLTLDKVSVWESGVEATIKASWGIAEIEFFDTRFLINRHWYESGRLYDFILAGIAYDARPAEHLEMPVKRHPDEAAWLSRHLSVDEAPVPSELTISLDGSAIFLPITDWDRDDYSFHAPIKSVCEFKDWLGQEGWRVRATVMRFDEDADLDIYITRKVWSGSEPPQIGQDIEGRLWLQGYLWLAHH